MYVDCKKKCAEMLADSPWLRKQFLAVKLHEAEENGREDKANKIQAIMRRENQRRNWRSIDREMGIEELKALPCRKEHQLMVKETLLDYAIIQLL